MSIRNREMRAARRAQPAGFAASSGEGLDLRGSRFTSRSIMGQADRLPAARSSRSYWNRRGGGAASRQTRSARRDPYPRQYGGRGTVPDDASSLSGDELLATVDHVSGASPCGELRSARATAKIASDSRGDRPRGPSIRILSLERAPVEQQARARVAAISRPLRLRGGRDRSRVVASFSSTFARPAAAAVAGSAAACVRAAAFSPADPAVNQARGQDRV